MKHEITNPKLRSFLFFFSNLSNVFVNSSAIATYSHLFLSFRYFKINLSYSRYHYLLNKLGGRESHRSIPGSRTTAKSFCIACMILLSLVVNCIKGCRCSTWLIKTERIKKKDKRKKKRGCL